MDWSTNKIEFLFLSFQLKVKFRDIVLDHDIVEDDSDYTYDGVYGEVLDTRIGTNLPNIILDHELSRKAVIKAKALQL